MRFFQQLLKLSESMLIKFHVHFPAFFSRKPSIKKHKIKPFKFLLLALGSLQGEAILAADLPACNRIQNYIDLGNGDILDPVSGLRWKRCPYGQKYNAETGCTGDSKSLSVATAERYAKAVSLAEGGNWHLPTLGNYLTMVGTIPRKQGWALQIGPPACAGIAWGKERQFSTYRYHGIGNYMYSKTELVLEGSDNRFTHRGNYVFLGAPWNEARAEEKQAQPANIMSYDSNSGSGDFRLVREDKFWGFESLESLENAVTKLKSLGEIEFFWTPVSSNKPPRGQMPSNLTNGITSDKHKQRAAFFYQTLATLLHFREKNERDSLPIAITKQEEEPVFSFTFRSKGEFETSVAYNDSRKQAENKLRLEFEKRHSEWRRARDEESATAIRAQKLVDERWNEPNAYAARAREFAVEAFLIVFGEPQFNDIRYDADLGRFELPIVASQGGIELHHSLTRSPDEAPMTKNALTSFKLAPRVKVKVQMQNITLTTDIVENAAQRADRFVAAGDDLVRLKELVDEFPRSAEATETLSRAPGIQKMEFDRARQSNSSSAYQSFLNRFRFTDSQGFIPKAQAALAAAKTREAAEQLAAQRKADAEYARECDAYYVGRTGQIKGSGLFATRDDYVVIAVNKDRHRVTIKGTGSGNSLSYGEIREFSCGTLNNGG